MGKTTKINKTILKSIVKECLIEILAEGIGEEQMSECRTRSSNFVKHKPTKTPQESKSLSDSAKKSRAEFLKEMAAEAAGNNPVMQELFKETIESGRAEEFANTSDSVYTAKDAVSQAIADKDPADIFGSETVSNWAAAAFQGEVMPDE